MSRILLLLIFLLWMAWAEGANHPVPPPDQLWAGIVVFLGCYALLVLGMRGWSALLARRVSIATFDRKLNRFNKMMFAARTAVPVWFGCAVFVLGWGDAVRAALGALLPAGLASAVVQLPGILLGTLPAFLAWVGLWWSQYPADQALREQNLVIQVEAGLPVYPSPSIRDYLLSNLRMQVLFTIVPILLILLVRDAGALGVVALTDEPPTQYEELFISLFAAGTVFLFAPEILRRVLHTEPLPDSPLRRRLEAMCRRSGMKYRDILLWKTQNNMGNAAVMGLVPRVRYILLSDLLLERMDDEQIEAVFAHEVGHVIHGHMAWFVVFFVVFFGGLTAVEQVFGQTIELLVRPLGAGAATALSVVGMAAAFMILFGYLSRRFERQADVYAARTMEASRSAGPGLDEILVGAAGVGAAAAGAAARAGGAAVASRPVAALPASAPAARQTYVGQYGATLFASALHRVAVINNIPIAPRRRRLRGLPPMRRVGVLLDDAVESAHNWLHGSIPRRMEYLRGLSADPALTGRFDRFMVRLYCTLLFALFLSAACCYATWKA